MPNCQYCNKPVISGTICPECAKQRQSNPQRPSGGFSLNSLLRNSFPTPPSRQQQVQAAPVPAAPIPQSSAPMPPRPNIQPQVSQQVSQPNINLNNLQNNRPVPTAVQPAAPAPIQNNYVSDPSISAAALDQIKGPSKSSQNDKENTQEEKELRERVFNSPATGFGDEELEVTVLSGIMKDQYVLESLKGKGLMVGLFSNHHTRSIYQAILSLREESSTQSKVDKIILKNKLRQMNIFDDLATRLLDKIQEAVPPSVEQSAKYLELLKEIKRSSSKYQWLY